MTAALIFDFDGTILDTESPWYDLVRELYAAYGFELPLADYLRCIGSSEEDFDVYAHLELLVGRPLDKKGIRDELVRRHGRLMDAAALRPGVAERLAEARGLGLPLAIASSSPRQWVRGFLDRFGLADHFPVLASADDVDRVKPDPALFQVALLGLGCRPEEALVFEDSANGLAAARAAGIACVAVPNRLTAHSDFAGAWRRYAGFDEFRLAELLDARR